jgi:hypothetical protein
MLTVWVVFLKARLYWKNLKKCSRINIAIIIDSIHNETIVIIANAHARLSKSWKWTSKIID